jgi:hypothetical protein
MSIHNTTPNETGATVAPDARHELPNALTIAEIVLIELASDTGEDEFNDTFANNGARNFAATLATLDTIRRALDSIEATARHAAAREARWHSENLTAWQAANVLPEIETEAA